MGNDSGRICKIILTSPEQGHNITTSQPQNRKQTMKTVKSMFHKAVKAINETAKEYFAQYVVVDNFGTRVLCWTEKGAFSWLSACGDKAMILDTMDYKMLFARVQ
jgi:hypothetical protein